MGRRNRNLNWESLMVHRDSIVFTPYGLRFIDVRLQGCCVLLKSVATPQGFKYFPLGVESWEKFHRGTYRIDIKNVYPYESGSGMSLTIEDNLPYFVDGVLVV